MLIRFAIVAVCLSLCHKNIISLRAERCRREARRWEVYPWELYRAYPPHDPPQPSRPKAGLGLVMMMIMMMMMMKTITFRSNATGMSTAASFTAFLIHSMNRELGLCNHGEQDDNRSTKWNWFPWVISKTERKTSDTLHPSLKTFLQQCVQIKTSDNLL